VVNSSISLPHNADADRVSVACIDGLITVTVPKIAPPPPTTITVDPSPPSMSEETPHYTLTVAAPGLAAEDVVIQATYEAGSFLKIKGETKRTGSRLDRTYRLPQDADAELTQASHIDGLLTLCVPKKPVSVRRIPINLQTEAVANAEQPLDPVN